MVRRFNVGLVIIDSVAANYRAEHGSSIPKDLANRATQLTKLGRMLRRLALTDNLAVVVANQVSDRFESMPNRAVPNAVSSSPSVASSPASQGQKISTRTNQRDQLRADIMSLDHQQRFFTGWGDDLAVIADGLKTPTLGLGWTNQIAARIVLKMEGSKAFDRTVNSPEDDLNGNLWKDRKKRRFLSLVFAPWMSGTLKPVEFEITKEGIRSIGSEKRSNWKKEL
jgi:DNA repair protein RAD57